MKLLTLEPLPLGVPRYLPKSVGGGQVAVDFVHTHPIREADAFWLSASMFLLVVVLFILIQIINCCCSCVQGRVGLRWNNLHSTLNWNCLYVWPVCKQRYLWYLQAFVLKGLNRMRLVKPQETPMCAHPFWFENCKYSETVMIGINANIYQCD